MFIIGSNDYLNCYKSFENLALLAPSLEAFITKSITLNPRSGNKLPHYYSKDNYVLVSSGICNLGIKNIANDISLYLKNFNNHPIIIPSIAADPDSSTSPIIELVEIVKQLDNIGIKNIEINLACPNVIHNIKIKEYVETLLDTLLNLYTNINFIPKITTSNINELIELITIIKKLNVHTVAFAPYMPAIMFDDNIF